MITTESLWTAKYRRLQALKSERQSYDAHWKELQAFFLPRRGRWLDDSQQRGNKRHQALVDPTPKMAARTLASGMMSGSTNPAQPWFRLVTPDPELMERPNVSRWLYSVENRMRDVFEKSNLYRVLPVVYLETGVFGTSPLMIFKDQRTVIRCEAYTVGSYYLAQNDQGVVDTLYREYKMTARQMWIQFEGNVSPQVRKEYESGGKDQWHDVLHVVEPNADYDSTGLASKMPWRSCYFDKAWPERALKESGFSGNPLALFRWETTAEDVYGSSPGMDALGVAKAMQLQQRRKAQAIDKHLDPPMVGDPTMENTPSSLLPGDVTYAGFTANGAAPKFQPAYIVKPELQWMLQDIQDIRELTNTCMFVDLFQMFGSLDRREITAEEIQKRYEEKLLLIGPALGNHKEELIKPLIDRTFDIMVEASLPVWQGKLNAPLIAAAFIPPPPDELGELDLKIEMISPLAQAMKQATVGGIERLVTYVGMLAQTQAAAGQTPTAFDKIDLDQSIDEMGQAIGVPPTMLVSDEDVAAIRDKRQQAQQAAQMASQVAPALNDAAAATKNFAQAQQISAGGG